MTAVCETALSKVVVFRLTLLLATLALSAAACAEGLPESVGVVVSADRLKQGVSNLTAVHSDDDMSASTRSLLELTDRISSLHLNAGGAGSFGSLLTYRGLSNTPYFSDPAVTVYLDDLPLPGAFTYPTMLIGFNDAVLARGPQGSAFGRAGSGGVISFLSGRPGPTAGAELRLGAGNYAERFLTVAAHTAAMGEAGSNDMDATVSASVSQRDGYIRNEQLHTRVDDQKGGNVSGRMRWRPNDAAQYTVQWLVDRHGDGAQPLVPLGGPWHTVARERDGETDIHLTGLAAKGEFDTAIGRLSTATSYTDWRLDPYDNQLILPPTLDSRIVQEQRAWNEELRLASREGSGLHWNLGAWFSDSDTEGDVVRSIPDLFPIESSHFDLASQSGALFGELHVPLARGWLMTAGLRLERIERNFHRLDRLAIPEPAIIDGRRIFEAALPKLALTRALSPRTSMTVTASVGSKPGGWSAFTGNASLAEFEPEKTTAMEASVDSRLLGDAVRISARAFLYDIKNYQIERSFTEVDYLVVNAPRARSTGLEFEGEWRASQHLTVAAGLGLAHAVLRDFTDVFTHISYAGNRVPYTPGYDAHLNAAWRTPHWFAVVEITSTGKTFFDEAQSGLFAQSSHTTVNARAGHEFGRARIAFYGQNLTDERYYTLIVPGVLHAAPAMPRTWGVELTVRTGK